MRLPAATSTPSGSRRACSTSIKTHYWSFIPRRGSGRTERAVADPPRPRRRPAIERARDGAALTPEELTALFAETRPEAIEDMRQAADELRAELAGETVTFVVNRNINVSNVCIVGCAFCGFGQGKRSPDAYEHDERRSSSRASREAVDYGATEICMQSGIHPGLGARGLPALAARRQGRRAPARLHLHAYSPMEIAHMCDISGLPPAEVFARLRDAGPRTRRRAPRPRCSTTACASGSARTSCRSRAGSRSSRPATAPGCARPSTVMFGHIEEPWELAEHMRVVRELQERTGGITEFVPLSFIPFHTLLGPHARDRGDLAARRTSSTPPSSASRSAARSATCRRAG